VDFHDGITLYSYQIPAAEAMLKAGYGVLVMPCGAGKTQTGLKIAAEIGERVLWLTHTHDLLQQSMSRAKDVYGLPDSAFGVISEGKVEVGSVATFATVQTMAAADLSGYADTWGTVVVDECHHCVGSPTNVTQFYKVLSQLRCAHKYGLTATPGRADGMERCMEHIIGPVMHEVPLAAVACNLVPVTVRPVRTGYQPNMDSVLCPDGTIDYAALVKDLIWDPGRLECATEVIAGAAREGVLVLANRVSYLEELELRLKAKGLRVLRLSGKKQGKKAKEERNAAIEAMRERTADVLLATYQLAKEGLDIPALRNVVFATPEKDPTTVQQSAGRVARKAEGKEGGTVWDLCDEFGMYKGWAKKRAGIYRKLGYEVKEWNTR
jgi:superfamily II DNA or RNA helicase